MTKEKTRLTNKDIIFCYDTLEEESFFATIAGWNVTVDRVLRILGKRVARRYLNSDFV